MAGMQVSGLVSGLDTATIVNQLMQLEAAPQNALKAKVTRDRQPGDGLPGRQHPAHRRARGRRQAARRT